MFLDFIVGVFLNIQHQVSSIVSVKAIVLYETLIPKMFFDQTGPKVGRASVPADMGRHGGRPYVSARS